MSGESDNIESTKLAHRIMPTRFFILSIHSPVYLLFLSSLSPQLFILLA